MNKVLGFLFIMAVSAVLTTYSYYVKSAIRQHSFVEKENPKTEIIVTGDIMLGRTVMTTSQDKGDPHYPFTEVADRLREADIVFINLENPVVDDCPRHYDGFIFCADPEMVKGLTYAGVDIVSLANNHTLNYGNDGLEQTKNFLTKAGIDYVGAENLVIKETNGTMYGFLGFEFLTDSPEEIKYKLVSESDSKVDVLIVGVHWGNEYKDIANDHQRRWGRELVENGADIVVGHHPHWVQDMEYINGKPVYYSLGNFIFDQMWSDETRRGMAIKFTFENGKVIENKEMPVFMEEWAKPKWTN